MKSALALVIDKEPTEDAEVVAFDDGDGGGDGHENAVALMRLLRSVGFVQDR